MGSNVNKYIEQNYMLTDFFHDGTLHSGFQKNKFLTPNLVKGNAPWYFKS